MTLSLRDICGMPTVRRNCHVRPIRTVLNPPRSPTVYSEHVVLMFMVRVIDVVVRAVRLMTSGSPAGIALLVLVVIAFTAGVFSMVALGAWLLANLQNNHGWTDAVLPCALGGTCAP